MVKVKFTLDRRTDGHTDRQGDSYIPPQTSFAGGYNNMTCMYTVDYPVMFINTQERVENLIFQQYKKCCTLADNSVFFFQSVFLHVAWFAVYAKQS